MKNYSELRRDIVSGDWVVIATGRAKRPDEFARAQREVFTQPKSDCPFEKQLPSPLVVYALDGKSKTTGEWWVQAVTNKYPAFSEGACPEVSSLGPYQYMRGIGFHEVIITRNHERDIAQMSVEEVELAIRCFQDRFISIKKNGCVKYISIFQNHGKSSGASLPHPHSQLIAVPVIPPDIRRSLEGSRNYFHAHKQCVHCVALKHEICEKTRIIYENDYYVALTPFASKSAFESRIFPKKHNSRFEEINSNERFVLSDALRVILAKLYKGLGNPDYNFFIHTAPVGREDEFKHYHWHLEIMPKTAIWAGFEIGTGIEISTITPETAAGFLRQIKV